MNFLKISMALFFLLVLAGCSSSRILEGKVVSSRAAGQGITEHLIETDSVHTPYYILRTNTNTLQQGSKVMLELSANSMLHSGY
jgi:hypothetical protein